MYYVRQLDVVQKILKKCNIQSLIINGNDSVDERFDRGLRNLFVGENPTATFFEYFPDTAPKTVYRAIDVFFCRYMFLRLPPDDEKVFVVGPYLANDISREQILEQTEKMGLLPSYSKKLELYYAAVPIVREEKYVSAVIDSLAELLFGENNGYEKKDISREDTAVVIKDQLHKGDDKGAEKMNIQLMEDRYRFENEIILAVSKGDIHKAELMIASFSNLAFEKRVSDPLRNIKNYSVIMNTILRKAAEKGGVHPVYLDSVSSDFATRIEAMTSISQSSELMHEMLKTYCRLVRRHSVKKYSAPVQKAIIKIESDLSGELNLKTLAKLSNVSPAYFSTLFKKETGQTLTTYINGKRIENAKHLLKNTSLQIQTVAQHCGILDLHYFCRIFKAATGKTPSEYRDNIFFD